MRGGAARAPLHDRQRAGAGATLNVARVRRRAPPKALAQTLALAYWSFHYAKRILETFFVHK